MLSTIFERAQLTKTPIPLDGCAYPTCASPRTREGIPCCPQHRCLQPQCDRPRQVEDGSFFCDKHTCSVTSCNASASSSAEDAPPFCELHRPCAHEGCPRRCHTREQTGQMAPFCGAHYCPVEGCPEERREGGNATFCEKHSCIEAGCFNGRSGQDEPSRFCVEHECQAEGCLARVDVRVRDAEHCPLHRCIVEGCAQPATTEDGGARCANHRYCVVDGCREWVFVEKIGGDEVRHPECENRESSSFCEQCKRPRLTTMPCIRPRSPMPGHQYPHQHQM